MKYRVHFYDAANSIKDCVLVEAETEKSAIRAVERGTVVVTWVQEVEEMK